MVLIRRWEKNNVELIKRDYNWLNQLSGIIENNRDLISNVSNQLENISAGEGNTSNLSSRVSNLSTKIQNQIVNVSADVYTNMSSRLYNISECNLSNISSKVSNLSSWNISNPNSLLISTNGSNIPLEIRKTVGSKSDVMIVRDKNNSIFFKLKDSGYIELHPITGAGYSRMNFYDKNNSMSSVGIYDADHYFWIGGESFKTIFLFPDRMTINGNLSISQDIYAANFYGNISSGSIGNLSSKLQNQIANISTDIYINMSSRIENISAGDCNTSNISSRVSNLSSWNSSSPTGKHFGGNISTSLDVYGTTFHGNISNGSSLSFLGNVIATQNWNINQRELQHVCTVQSDGQLELNSLNEISFQKNGIIKVYCDNDLYPALNDSVSLGKSTFKWSNVYATMFHGNISSGTTENLSSKLQNQIVNISSDIYINMSSKIENISIGDCNTSNISSRVNNLSFKQNNISLRLNSDVLNLTNLSTQVFNNQSHLNIHNNQISNLSSNVLINKSDIANLSSPDYDDSNISWRLLKNTSNITNLSGTTNNLSSWNSSSPNELLICKTGSVCLTVRNKSFDTAAFVGRDRNNSIFFKLHSGGYLSLYPVTVAGYSLMQFFDKNNSYGSIGTYDTDHYFWVGGNSFKILKCYTDRITTNGNISTTTDIYASNFYGNISSSSIGNLSSKIQNHIVNTSSDIYINMSSRLNNISAGECNVSNVSSRVNNLSSKVYNINNSKINNLSTNVYINIQNVSININKLINHSIRVSNLSNRLYSQIGNISSDIYINMSYKIENISISNTSNLSSRVSNLSSDVLANKSAISNLSSGEGNWKYKRNISLSINTSLSNYQILLSLNTSNFNYSNANISGNDIRFYQISGTPLDYWIENWNSTGESKVWIEVKNINTSLLVLIYGNSSVNSMSNLSNTFLFGDDFSTNLSNWTTGGSPSISEGKITLSQNDQIRSSNKYGSDIATRIDFQRQSSSEAYGRIGLSNSSLDISFSADDAAYRFVYDSYEDFYSVNESSKTDSTNDSTYNTKKTLEIQRLSNTITAKYLTGWTKSGSNPLKDIGTAQGWFAAVYNNYDDKFYLYVQDKTGADNQFQCYSFNKSDAETPANWSSHGNVFNASESWERQWIEPHSIIWETQTMADARENVGAGEGTPKWRIYYCACSNSNYLYDMGFAITSENSMTNLSAYSNNPVYVHNVSYTYPDGKAVVYNDKVWMLLGRYVGSTPQNCFFTYSTNGIGGANDSWSNVNTNYDSDWLLGTLNVLNGGIGTYKANDSSMEAGFSTNGLSIIEYSNNPTLLGTESWEDVIGWISLTQTKNTSCLIDNYYYLWYWGVTAGAHKLCLAKTQTITEEENSSHSITLTCTGDSESPWSPSTNIPDEDMNMRIEQNNTSADLYVHLALVRKYVSAEPSTILSTEEEGNFGGSCNISTCDVYPALDNTYNIGNTSLRYSNIHAINFYGNLSSEYLYNLSSKVKVNTIRIYNGSSILYEHTNNVSTDIYTNVSSKLNNISSWNTSSPNGKLISVNGSTIALEIRKIIGGETKLFRARDRNNSVFFQMTDDGVTSLHPRINNGYSIIKFFDKNGSFGSIGAWDTQHYFWVGGETFKSIRMYPDKITVNGNISTTSDIYAGNFIGNTSSDSISNLSSKIEGQIANVSTDVYTNMSNKVSNLSSWNISSPSGKFFGGNISTSNDIYGTMFYGNISCTNGCSYLADLSINQIEPLYGTNTGTIGQTSKFSDIYATTIHGNLSSGDIFMKHDWILKEDKKGLLLVKGKRKFRINMTEIFD